MAKESQHYIIRAIDVLSRRGARKIKAHPFRFAARSALVTTAVLGGLAAADIVSQPNVFRWVATQRGNCIDAVFVARSTQEGSSIVLQPFSGDVREEPRVFTVNAPIMVNGAEICFEDGKIAESGVIFWAETKNEAGVAKGPEQEFVVVP
jgi:hypothetical protein